MESKRFTHFNKPVTIPQNYELLVSNLIAARYAEGISQESLAHRIGCTASLIHKWETHKRIPSGFMLMCWLDSLGYEIEVKRREGIL